MQSRYIRLAAALNLRHVEIFRAVMLSGTTQRAAEVLRISQPGVSRAVQELERQLGFALFHRVRRRLVPTAEAGLYLREVEESFAALSRLGSAGARIRDFGSGQIRIATLSGLSTTIVPRALKRFRDGHPGVSVSLQVRMSATVKQLVQSGRFDLGLAADEIDTTGIDAVPFAAFAGVLALPSGHPLCRLDAIGPGDLHEVDFVALSPEDTARQALDRLLAEAGATPRVVLETPFANTVCAMVQAGLGCGFVNPLTAEPFLGRGLELRPFRPVVLFRTLLLRPVSGPDARIVGDCVAALTAEAEAARAALPPALAGA